MGGPAAGLGWSQGWGPAAGLGRVPWWRARCWAGVGPGLGRGVPVGCWRGGAGGECREQLTHRRGEQKRGAGCCPRGRKERGVRRGREEEEGGRNTDCGLWESGRELWRGCREGRRRRRKPGLKYVSEVRKEGVKGKI